MSPQDAPPPGSYNVIQSFQRSQVKAPVAQPRSHVANRKHGSFLTASSRFAPSRDIPSNRPDIENPGGWSLNTAAHQGCTVHLQSWSDWPGMGQIRDFFRSDFSTFWLGFVPFEANLIHIAANSKIPDVGATCGAHLTRELIAD